LLGSRHFAAHPTVPLDRMVANINLDMVGRNHPDTVVAIGQEYTDLGSTVQQVAQRHEAELRLKVAPDRLPGENLFMRSDHFSFASRGVPAIFFSTGLHADYHRQSDEPDTIDHDKVARIARLIQLFGEEVANAATRPQWTAAGKARLGLD
jgi:Zn-dependent M28 family amino/carboxypeptidase